MATLQEMLASPDQSVRLKAALAAGTYPRLDFIEVLIRQCSFESDFFVRDTLSWALLRNDQDAVVRQLIPELQSENLQAKTQALHTLTKIGNKNNYSLITKEMLLDSDDFVASTSWRAASVLVPDEEKLALVEILITQLARGDSDVQFALTRFMCAIGEASVESLIKAAQSSDEAVRHHAEFTLIRYREMKLDTREKRVKPDE